MGSSECNIELSEHTEGERDTTEGRGGVFVYTNQRVLSEHCNNNLEK